MLLSYGCRIQLMDIFHTQMIEPATQSSHETRRVPFEPHSDLVGQQDIKAMFSRRYVGSYLEAPCKITRGCIYR